MVTNLIKTCMIILLAFAVPVGAATAWNWQEVRPYIVGDPNIAEGEMICFSVRG